MLLNIVVLVRHGHPSPEKHVRHIKKKRQKIRVTLPEGGAFATLTVFDPRIIIRPLSRQFAFGRRCVSNDSGRKHGEGICRPESFPLTLCHFHGAIRRWLCSPRGMRWRAGGSAAREMEVTRQVTQERRVSGGYLLDAKEQVRQAIDIVDLVGGYVQLRRQGRGYVGRCPWHDDSRPSLQVNPERQSWKCWVCDIGGDIFSFVMQAERVEFREALEMLAERAGVEIRQPRREPSSPPTTPPIGARRSPRMKLKSISTSWTWRTP